MTKSRKLPPQSPQCVADASVVLVAYPDAEAYFERKTAVVHIAGSKAGEMHKLGIGGTAEAAWADARRNIERPPVPELPNRGTSTWSLKSDEEYWKHE